MAFLKDKIIVLLIVKRAFLIDYIKPHFRISSVRSAKIRF